MDSSKFLILGANGQLGKALSELYPDAIKTDSEELDITSSDSIKTFNWGNISTVLNAAAYTNVDGAETADGGAVAWKVNDEAVGNLVDIANKENLLFVHISTAYVFDGKQKSYKEDDRPNPLGNYAKSKAAGEQKAAKASKYYVVRTDSVIGEGKNFVRTMLELGRKGVDPRVVSDQIIRPTFTTELAKAIKFLIDKPAEFGTYNVTNEGDPVSWADFTRAIFKDAGFDREVIDTTYKEYSAGKPGVAPRPLNSMLDLGKIESIGFKPRDWHESLREYIKKEMNQ